MPLAQVLNGVGAYCAMVIFAIMPWDAAVLIERGWSPLLAGLLAGGGQAASALAGAVLSLNAIFTGATFFATLYASMAFDVNAKAFLESVHRVRAQQCSACSACSAARSTRASR